MSCQKVINTVEEKKVRNTGSVGRPGVTFSSLTKVSFMRKAGRDEPFEYLEKDHSRKREGQKQRL